MCSFGFGNAPAAAARRAATRVLIGAHETVVQSQACCDLRRELGKPASALARQPVGAPPQAALGLRPARRDCAVFVKRTQRAVAKTTVDGDPAVAELAKQRATVAFAVAQQQQQPR